MSVDHSSLRTADQPAAERKLLREGRDAVSLYLETRGLAGLTIPCRVDYYRRILSEKDGQRTHHTRLALKIASLIVKQFWPVLRHIPAVMALSLKQSLTKTAMQTLRTTPVTLAAMILLFLTSDAWKICGNERLEQVVVILATALVISVLFFFAGSDNTFGTWTSDIMPDPKKDNIKKLAQRTVPEAKNLTHLELARGSEQLGRLELINVRTIYVILIVVNFLAVGFWAMLALLLFGVLIFDESAQAGLMGGIKHIHSLVAGSVGGYPIAVTWQLILVSLILAGIAVLSFAATGLQDKDARDAFVKPNVDDLKSCISAFYFYRAAVNVVGAGGSRTEQTTQAGVPSAREVV
jgi:hypothetical protein